ncbi:MAG: sarcosine oxidase subunit beta [Halobacteriales archaeon]|jgi:sarcosine oxidase subunit beta
MTKRVAVVGAGAVGATAAFDLALRDAEVTLYDRGQVASGATGRAAGVCYDAFADHLDAEIASHAIERFRTFHDNGEFQFNESAFVSLVREGDEERERSLRERVERMQDRGTVVLEMGAAELAERFPSIHADDVAVAAVAGASGYTDPGRYARLLSVLAKQQGADLRTGQAVTVGTDPLRVEPDAGDDRPEYDAVLVAAGAHTKALLADAGLSIAMKPYRVQATTVEAAYVGPMVHDASGGFYLRPHSTGILAGDGTETVAADPDDYDRDADEGFGENLAKRVSKRLSTVDGTPEAREAWAGLCTATPDGDPLVGELEDGLFIATGFQGHGFMRAPAIAERVALEILDGDGIDPYDPTRFAGDEDFEIVEGMSIETE